MKIETLLVFTIAAGACVPLIAADSRDSQIVDREKAFGDAWEKRDPQAMARVITDDFLIVTRASTIMDRKQFLDGLKGGSFSQNNRDRVQMPKDLLIRYYGPSTAVVTYSDQGPWGPPGKEIPTLHRFTHVWVNPDGKGWRMASRHVSLPPARPQ